MRIQRKRFVDDLVSVQPGLSLKGTTQQSESYLFKDGCIYTYNGQVWCCCTCDMDLPEAAVPGQNLLEVLEKWNEEEIVVAVVDNKMSFTGKSNGVTHRITHPVEKIYVKDLDRKLTNWRPLPEDFTEAVKTVAGCAEPKNGSNVLPQYSWIHIHPEWIEASDNLQVCRWPMKTGFGKSYFVQASALKEIVPRGMVSITDSCPGWITFSNGKGKGLDIAFLRFEGESYPDFSKVFSDKGEKINFPKAIAKEVKNAENYCVEGEIHRLGVAVRKGLIRITGRGNMGVYESQIPCSYEGPQISFTISPTILTKIVEQHSECLLHNGRLMATTPRYIWLGVTHDS